MTQYRRYTNSLLRVARYGATLATPGVTIDRSFVYIIGAQALSAAKNRLIRVHRVADQVELL